MSDLSITAAWIQESENMAEVKLRDAEISRLQEELQRAQTDAGCAAVHNHNLRGSNEHLRNRWSEAREEFTELAKISAKRINELQKQVDEAEEDHGSTIDEYNELVEDIWLKNEILASIALLADYDKEKDAEWEAEVDQLADDIGVGQTDVLRQVVDRMASSFKEAIKSYQELELELEDCKVQVAVKKANDVRIKYLERKIQETDDLYQDEKAKSAKKDERIASLLEIVDAQKKELADKDALLTGTKNSARAFAAKQGEKMKELRASLSESETDRRELRQRVKSLEDSAVEYDFEDMHKTVAHATQTIGSLGEQVNSLQDALNASQSTIIATKQATEIQQAQHRLAIDAVQEKLQETEEALRHSQVKGENFRLDLNFALTEIDKYNTIVEGLRQQNGRLREEYRELEDSKRASVRAVSQEADATIRDNHNVITRLNGELQALKQQHEGATRKIHGLESLLSSYTTAYDEWMRTFECMNEWCCFGLSCSRTSCFCRNVVGQEADVGHESTQERCSDSSCPCQSLVQAEEAESASEDDVQHANLGDGEAWEEVVNEAEVSGGELDDEEVRQEEEFHDEEYELLSEGDADSESDGERFDLTL